MFAVRELAGLKLAPDVEKKLVCVAEAPPPGSPEKGLIF